jgi:hypothetical protein
VHGHPARVPRACLRCVTTPDSLTAVIVAGISLRVRVSGFRIRRAGVRSARAACGPPGASSSAPPPSARASRPAHRTARLLRQVRLPLPRRLGAPAHVASSAPFLVWPDGGTVPAARHAGRRAGHGSVRPRRAISP